MKEFDQPFTNPGVVIVQMRGKEISIESAPNIFKFARIWHLVGKNFICIEPWTRDNFALDNPSQSLWIKPDESVTLSVIIGAKIIKQLLCFSSQTFFHSNVLWFCNVFPLVYMHSVFSFPFAQFTKYRVSGIESQESRSAPKGSPFG